MVLQYLKELVGDYKQPIIIDGELLLNKTAVIYCKKDRGNVIFLTVNNKKDEIFYDTKETLDLIQQKINESMKKYPFALPKEYLVPPVCCKLTNAIVINTVYYQLMSNSMGHEISNKNVVYEVALNEFYANELINYFSLYTRILRPRIARKANMKIKAHLIHNYFIPIRISTKNINCPFDYTAISAYISPLLHMEKVLLTSEKNQNGLELSVLAGCDFADICKTPVKPLEPNYVMFSIIYKCLTNFGKKDLVRFLNTYPSVVSALTIQDDESPSEVKINRIECFAALSNASFS